MKFEETVKKALDNWFVWGFFFIGNLVGTIMGFINYWPQLLQTPLHLWFWVPDCPMFTGLFCIFLLIFRMKRNYPVFNFILFVSLIKFAFATWFIIASYAPVYSTSLLQINIFFGFLHIGMAIDAVLILPFAKDLSNIQYILSSLFIFSNEVLDLTLGIWPWLPNLNFLNLFYIQNTIFNIVGISIFIFWVKRR